MEGLRGWERLDGVDKTPEWAESICAVPAETMPGFARLYARSKPVNLSVSFGIGTPVLRGEPGAGRQCLCRR